MDLTVAGEQALECHDCNYDTHRCPGCGTPLPHGTYACSDCNPPKGSPAMTAADALNDFIHDNGADKVRDVFVEQDWGTVSEDVIEQVLMTARDLLVAQPASQSAQPPAPTLSPDAAYDLALEHLHDAHLTGDPNLLIAAQKEVSDAKLAMLWARQDIKGCVDCSPEQFPCDDDCWQVKR